MGIPWLKSDGYDHWRMLRWEDEREDAGDEQDRLERERDLAAPFNRELDAYKDKVRAA